MWDFYIHGRINGKGKLLLLEIEDFRGRKIQLAYNRIDGKIRYIFWCAVLTRMLVKAVIWERKR